MLNALWARNTVSEQQNNYNCLIYVVVVGGLGFTEGNRKFIFHILL